MIHDGHQAVIDLAVKGLSGQEASFWAGLHSDMLSTCGHPDQFAIPLLEGKSGPWRRFFPRLLPRYNFEQTDRRPRACLPDVSFYMSQILKHFRAGEFAEGARFAGVFSHYVADFAEPAHYYELDIGRLFPPPPDMRNCDYHRTIEDVPTTARTVLRSARLLGETPGELQFRLESAFCRLQDQSVAAVIPMLGALYARRNTQATRLFNPIVQGAAAVFSDFCRTLGAIAHDRFPARDKKALAVCDLRQIEPHAFDVEFNFGNRPLLDVVTRVHHGHAEPFKLIVGRGPHRRVRSVKGICPVPHALPLDGVSLSSSLVYRLPRGTFRRFQCLAGLLAGFERQARVRFSVTVDGKVRFESRELGPESPAHDVDADVSGGTELILRVDTDGSTDRLAFPIWANPLLLK